MRWPRDVRTRLLLIVLVAVSVALVIATIGFNLLLARSNDQSADSLLRQRADSERSLIRVAGGRLVPVETSSDEVGDSRVWLYEGGRTVEAPRARAATTAVAQALARGPSRFATVEDTDERLYSLPIVARGARVGTIVTGVSLAPYEQARRSALFASLVFAMTVLLIAGTAAAWLLRSALRPVRADDGAGRGVERARPRPAVRPRRAARRADTARLDPRPPARPDRREPAS